jgi:methylmalonyl-CoA mutase N-terminal domain/subunit
MCVGCLDRGLHIDDFAPKFSFFFNAHIDFFEEIGKYRAARRIWAREMRETFGAKNPRSWWLRFHTQTAGVSLTMQQPYVNLIRSTIEALAACWVARSRSM